MILTDARDFLLTPQGEAALEALLSVGYTARQITPDVAVAYRNGIPRRAVLGAVAYAGDSSNTENASIIVHPVANLKECRATIDALSVLPAPFFLLHDVQSNGFRIWAATTDLERNRTPREVIREVIPAERLHLALSDFRRDLNPATITDVRLGRTKFHSKVFKQIDPLQLLLLSEEANELTVVQHFGHALDEMREGPFDEIRAGELALQLLAWRVLVDGNILPDSTDVDEIYAAAKAKGLESYFTWNKKEEASKSFRQAALLMRGLVFNAFKVDMLRAIYQRTFSRATTRHLGRFDTPLWLTRRIIAHIPFESIPPNKRHVVDMTCGWGSFLVAAYERLKKMPDTRQPRNLVRYIHGNENDALTAGLARLALLLESGHNTWQVHHGDALTWDRLMPNSQSVIVGNPPFRTESGAASRSDYAFEFLDKAITALTPDGYLGIIMPASFEVKEAGSNIRERLLKEIDILDLWRLPGQVFKGTPERVTVIIGRKRSPSSGVVRIQETANGSHERFLLRQGIATATNFARDPYRWVDNFTFTRGRNPSRAVFQAYALLNKSEWQKISKRSLSDVAHIIYGLPAGSSSRARVYAKQASQKEWYLKINEQAIKPFCLDLTERREINFPDDLEEPGLGKNKDGVSKYELMQNEKVIIPTTLRQDWGQMLSAAVDKSGTLFSNNFWCFVPLESAKEEGITADAIAVILNWWVANGWIAEHRQFPAPNASVIGSIPFPARASKAFWTKVTAYGAQAAKLGGSLKSTAIDSEIMRAYDLGENDKVTSRLRDVFQWKLIKHEKGSLDKGVTNADERLSVSGYTVSIDETGGLLSAWLDYSCGIVSIKLPPSIPGWALRPEARFSATALLEKKGRVVALEDFLPEQYSYLSDSELSDKFARVQKKSDSRYDVY